MNVALINKCDAGNGIGFRVSVFVSGCRNACKGCHNPQSWSFNFGKEYTDETIKEIIESLDKEYIKGLSIIGGEPLEPENQEMVLKTIREVKNKFGETKDIWMWTGLVFEDLISGNSRVETKYLKEILSNVDVLIDGPFILEKRDIVNYPFRGSSNQRVLNCKESIIKGKTLNFLLK